MNLNPKMNNTVPESDRTINDVGFYGMFHINTTPPNALIPGAPYNTPSPLTNEVNESANSKLIDVGPTAHDITERTR